MSDDKHNVSVINSVKSIYQDKPQVAYETVIACKNLNEIISESEAFENLLMKLSGNLWVKGFVKKSYLLNELLLKYYQEKKETVSAIVCLVRMSAASIYLDEYLDANKLLVEAKELYADSKTENILLYSGILINLGITFIHLNKMEKGYENLLVAQDICRQNKLDTQLLNVYVNLIFYYDYIEDIVRKKNTAEKGLALALKLEQKEMEISFKNSLGSIYKEEGKFALAKKTFEECYEFLKNHEGRYDWKANALMNLGVIHLSLKNYDKCKTYLAKALEVAKQHSSFSIRFLIEMNQIELMIKQEKIFEVEKTLNNLRKEINDDTDWNIQVRFYMSLKWLLKKQNKYEKIYPIYEKIIDLQEKIDKQRFSKQIAQLEIELKVAQGKRENEILKEKNSELAEKNEKLMQAQKEIKELEMRNAVNAIAVTANHEINQPLAVISGVAELLQSRIDESDQEANRLFEQLFDSIYRIKGILSKFSNHKKISFKEYAGLCRMISFDDDND